MHAVERGRAGAGHERRWRGVQRGALGELDDELPLDPRCIVREARSTSGLTFYERRPDRADDRHQGRRPERQQPHPGLRRTGVVWRARGERAGHRRRRPTRDGKLLTDAEPQSRFTPATWYGSITRACAPVTTATGGCQDCCRTPRRRITNLVVSGGSPFASIAALLSLVGTNGFFQGFGAFGGFCTGRGGASGSTRVRLEISAADADVVAASPEIAMTAARAAPRSACGPFPRARSRVPEPAQPLFVPVPSSICRM